MAAFCHRNVSNANSQYTGLTENGLAAEPRQFVQRICALLRQYVKKRGQARQYVKREIKKRVGTWRDKKEPNMYLRDLTTRSGVILCLMFPYLTST